MAEREVAYFFAGGFAEEAALAEPVGAAPGIDFIDVSAAATAAVSFLSFLSMQALKPPVAVDASAAGGFAVTMPFCASLSFEYSLFHVWYAAALSFVNLLSAVVIESHFVSLPVTRAIHAASDFVRASSAALNESGSVGGGGVVAVAVAVAVIAAEPVSVAVVVAVADGVVLPPPSDDPPPHANATKPDDAKTAAIANFHVLFLIELLLGRRVTALARMNQ
jgi:hypothetical protein